MTSMFYAHGKFFETLEEMKKYCIDWPNMPLDLQEFKHQMTIRILEIETNNLMREGKITNKEAYQILRLSTDWVVE